MNIKYTESGTEMLDLVQTLWEKLNTHHQIHSRHFSKHFKEISFLKRKQSLLEKAASGALHIGLASDMDKKAYVGYCISTVSRNGDGEIESIYVEPEYRRQGIGETLMQKALSWMKGRNAESKVLGVVAGNEEVFDFYSRFGFFPRITILKHVDEAGSSNPP
jgi:ribosomal protein S18 acetylase RimI-like enzyme